GRGAGRQQGPDESAVREAQLPEAIERMQRRLAPEPRERQGRLWGAAYILMGLRYDEALADRLLEGVMTMEESATYRAILVRGERRILRLQATNRFGDPSPEEASGLEEIDSSERLEALSLSLNRASNWSEWLGLAAATPTPPRKRRRSSEP